MRFAFTAKPRCFVYLVLFWPACWWAIPLPAAETTPLKAGAAEIYLKLSADKTWLRDAADAGAEIVVRAHADRVVTENGRAAGVEATVTHDDLPTVAGLWTGADMRDQQTAGVEPNEESTAAIRSTPAASRTTGNCTSCARVTDDPATIGTMSSRR